MRQFLRATGLAVAVGAVLAACYPDRASQPNVYSSVTTLYDTLFAFDSAVTFYMPDSVVHLGGTDNISHVYDSLIIATTAENMVGRGYTRTADPTAADLTLNPAVTVKNNYDYTIDDWCAIWADWYPWICTGWIPEYPGDVVGYTYSTGTLFIAMADLTGGVPPNPARPPVVWLAGMNGLVKNGSTAAIAKDIVDGIDQAFDQSPYIYRVNR
ncbi:MAG: DUF4136 domain-containing protein [Gemmatimonadales bacterium]